MTVVFVASVVLVVSAVVLAILAFRTRHVRTVEPPAFVEFRAACDELERAVGEALLPAIERLAAAAERWRRSAR